MLRIPALITKVTTMSDNGIRLQVDTNEITDEAATALMGYRNKFGHFVFSESDIQDSDIPTEQVELKAKTPSQRLRAVLFILWKEKGEKTSFNDYYNSTLEKLIEVYKEKIDSL